MKTELKKSLSFKKTSLILSFLSIFFGGLCLVVGEISMPFLVATLSCLFLFDKTDRHYFAIATAVFVLLENIICFILGMAVTAFAPCAIILSLVLSFSYEKAENKSDASFLMTLIYSLFGVLTVVLFAMILTNEYTIESVLTFYGSIVDRLREESVTLLREAYALAGMEIETDLLYDLFDSQLKMIISFVLIGSFFVVGVAIKMFDFIVRKLDSDEEKASSWSFALTNIYGYAYAAIMLASIFINDTDSIFSVCVLNLYNFLLIVFAYVGFKHLGAFLKTKLRPFATYAIMIFVLLAFGSFALQLLSAIGVVYTIRTNNASKSSPV